MEEESERALRELGDLSEQEQQVVRAMAERLVRRVLYPVSRALREESATEAHRHAAAPTEDVSLKV